jgi:glucosylglycerate synthase
VTAPSRSLVDTALPLDVEGGSGEIGELDLLLAVLSHQHVRTIGGVVRALEAGVAARFPGARAAIVHWDAGSTDGTREAATQAAGDLRVLTLPGRLAPAPRQLAPVNGVPGGDLAFRAVCQVARASGARAVLLVGADLRVLPDEWVDRLLRPAWAGELDLVTPLFARAVLDGPVTTCLLYPLTRALYGVSVRALVTAELSLSRPLVARLCEASGWGTAASRTLPLFTATVAAATGARLGEAWLGGRDAEPREGRLDLGDIMSEAVGAAFALAELYEEQWHDRGPGSPPPRLGEPAATGSATPPAALARMVAVFRQGLRDLPPIWEQVLTAATLADLYALGDLAPEEFAFPPELWARVVYDFLLAHRFRTLHRGHLLRSLVPLYLGRMAGLSRDAAGQPASVQERMLERQAQAFETLKGELLDRWR